MFRNFQKVSKVEKNKHLSLIFKSSFIKLICICRYLVVDRNNIAIFSNRYLQYIMSFSCGAAMTTICCPSLSIAAMNGHLECLRYAHDSLGASCVWHPDTTRIAAAYGYLECLRYAHDNGCEWHPYTTWGVAINGHLECLRYAHDNGCEWHPKTTYWAARNGHLKCLMYIYEHCGDVVTWENANLDDEPGIVSENFPKEIQAFIDSVRDDWKCGLNKPGLMTKSAKRN